MSTGTVMQCAHSYMVGCVLVCVLVWFFVCPITAIRVTRCATVRNKCQQTKDTKDKTNHIILDHSRFCGVSGHETSQCANTREHPYAQVHEFRHDGTKQNIIHAQKIRNKIIHRFATK